MINEKVKGLEFKAVKDTPSWATFHQEIANKDGITYHKKKGSEIIYKQNAENFECLNCGSEILVRKVAHPIHDGPFPLSGSGKCYYEDVPYCPKCEKKPEYRGSLITIENK